MAEEIVERGMKCFLSDDLDQSLLMPPSLHDWLPENHLARFVVDLVETLDLSAFDPTRRRTGVGKRRTIR